MRALIMSDSHGWEQEMQAVIDRHEKKVDAIIHCGDSELSKSSPLLKNVHIVKGNCDFGGDFPEELTIDVQGTKVFVAHGHLLNVKMNEMNLIYKSQETGANIVCFGHTHIPVAFEQNGVIIINPGSIRLPRQYPLGTYVIVETSDEGTSVNYYSVDGMPQEKLNKTFLK
ncbi:metallophosphoesterase family protein [Evansella cellulosilytica]|uniref:Phosphoesterase n=1 Tax=Evansella cellulosilytica (strain ATCC 21833 / DSM 2522 / FERM P-1141 / JCM 9156 / N-4) TaxID=649639 RepID=E6TZT1_EVAC2|nr:metallophosphoesterase [Evansella cellulosilytica]ADU31387.1 phosphodiesterase, MJ0936 family [Evansella cellulosilytica DSM 2522]